MSKVTEGTEFLTSSTDLTNGQTEPKLIRIITASRASSPHWEGIEGARRENIYSNQ